MADEKEKEKKTRFECIYCHSSFLLDFIPPKEWTVSRYVEQGHYRFICENCGAFIYPTELNRGESPDADLFYMFSGCVNAYDCYLHNQYEPACEKPVLKPKCLHALYMEIENVNFRLDDIEKRLSGKEPMHQGFMDGKKPGTKLN